MTNTAQQQIAASAALNGWHDIHPGATTHLLVKDRRQVHLSYDKHGHLRRASYNAGGVGSQPYRAPGIAAQVLETLGR
ncbi:hypothetical protein CH253_07985 [Rhodococcus sp. 06-156-3C]|uniref:hypothetical protein n=1 Tax=Rhodococcus sp. 06-156-3C TaxID=2022486 RepID=UPI000B9AADAF|nr:hypothetical protein [Rhodococcus sp. 06-156-3C]OZD23792.1 hypothetical protein CH253_07985 [Rhodococcus sp. 06-156-3C]